MARVEIAASLVLEIKRKFSKAEANRILGLIETLRDSPSKGKTLGTVGGIVVKEVRYKKFRFYFLADGFKLKFLREEELTDVLIRFVRMSDKKHQQETINEIRHVLTAIGPGGVE